MYITVKLFPFVSLKSLWFLVIVFVLIYLVCLLYRIKYLYMGTSKELAHTMSCQRTKSVPDKKIVIYVCWNKLFNI